MDTQTATPTVETTTVAVPEIKTPDKPVSLMDHAEAFDPTPAPAVSKAKDTPDKGPDGKFLPRERHRAKSQTAGAEDVGRIGELTKKWRTTEQERDTERAERAKLAEERDALRREIEGLKKVTPSKDAPTQATSGFTKPKPTLADFENEADPLDAWTDAKAAWYAEKAEFERGEQQKKTQAEAAEIKTRSEMQQAFETNRAEFVKTHADFDEVLKKSPHAAVALPINLHAAIYAHDKSAEIVYALAQRPDLMDEALLFTSGKAFDEALVASTQRWLERRVQAVTTGAVAASQSVSRVPKPLTPVRTGPVKTDDDPLDGLSVRAHAQRFKYR